MKKFCPLHLVNSDVKANVTCAVYSYNGEELVGTYNDEDIYLFRGDHSDGAGSIHRYTGHRNNATVKGVNFYGPMSEFIVSGSDCSNVFIWEKESEKIVQYFHADDGGVVNVLEPHPHAPILATSGLDHDVKIWTPMAEEPTKLAGLARVTRRNTKEREEERENEPDMIDGQMLWLLMQHLRRSARRRARNEGEDLSSSSSEHSDHHEDDENDDGDGDAEMGESMQCVPS
jgi:WD repeat-containing protein 42A